jgi:ribosomal protein S18 acetylase RimI-like enzyme
LTPSLVFLQPRRQSSSARLTVPAIEQRATGSPLVRFYRSEDRSAVVVFDCETYGEDFTREARAIIRQAPDYLSDDEITIWIIVAEDESRLVGVVVFGDREDGTPHIFSLGVVRDRRCEGIGTKLKRAALWEFRQRGIYEVRSHVENRNYRMLGLNDKLGVNREPHPEEQGMYLCLAVLDTTPDDAASR